MRRLTTLLYIGVSFLLVGGLTGCQSEESTPALQDGVSQSDAAGVAFRDTLTLTGTLIDATCHARADVEATAACEGKYVQAGYPVGIQTGAEPASVWILVTVPQALADYLTATVRVTGVVRSEGVLIPHRMAVQNGSTWTSIM